MSRRVQYQSCVPDSIRLRPLKINTRTYGGEKRSLLPRRAHPSSSKPRSCSRYSIALPLSFPSLFHEKISPANCVHPSMYFFPRREMRARAILLPDMHGLVVRAGVRQPEPGHEGQGGPLHRQGGQALLPLYQVL